MDETINMITNMTLNNKLNYEQFLEVKNNILLDKPDIINLSENNLYKFFNYEFLKDIYKEYDKNGYTYHINGKVHRCHLVEDWLRNFNVNEAYKKNIGFSHGVKESLSILSSSKDFKNKKWLIPSDVYPVYQKILSSNFSPIAYYDTLISASTPFYFNEHLDDNNDVFQEADILIITLPLKPSGISGSSNGLNNLYSLIANNPNKTFIIDSVYLSKNKDKITDVILNNSEEDMEYLISLFNLGNVFILTSLSKNWSMPNIMGLAFIPDKYLYLRELFKTIHINEETLKTAYLLLNKYSLIPVYISSCLFEMRNSLDNYWNKNFNYSFFKNLDLGHKHLIKTTLYAGYLYHIDLEPDALLEENILAIPASVFGGKSGSVISVLNHDLSK